MNGPVPVGSAASTTDISTSMGDSANTRAASHHVKAGCSSNLAPVSAQDATWFDVEGAEDLSAGVRFSARNNPRLTSAQGLAAPPSSFRNVSALCGNVT